MHAAKHFDPQLGIDIHLTMLGPLGPFPLPTPHIGIVLDPFDYIPVIGSTVDVNGVKRATAGTGGLDVHIPLGIWLPTMKMPAGPQWDDELFMGSMTVSADGDPMSRIGMPVLDCNVVGLINPFRLRKPKKPQLSMSLPTAVNLAIPSNVVVGGPPMISIAGMLFKGAFHALGKGLGALRRSKKFIGAMDNFRSWRKARFGELPAGFLKCKVLRAEPVDIRRGAVVVEHEDFIIPGRLPMVWMRRYTSLNDHAGAVGHGWETPADTRLEIEPDGTVVFRPPSGALAVFERLPATGQPTETLREWIDGARLTRGVREHVTELGETRARNELQVRTKDDLVYVFTDPGKALAPLHAPLVLEIERIEDLSGNHWRFERAQGRLVRVIESGSGAQPGRSLLIEQFGDFAAVTPSARRDGTRRTTHIHHIALYDPATGSVHPLVRYGQDEHGDLIAAHDALDAPRRFAYAGHRMLSHTDRVGLSFYYAYDGGGRVLHAWGDGGLYDYRFAYNDLLHETEITDSLGATSIVKFDDNDLPLCEIDALGGVSFFEYDDLGRTTAMTDPNGLRTGFGYDERGNLTELVRPDDSRIGSRFDADDNLVEIIDPAGGVWQQAWDARGLMTEQRTPLGAISAYAYDKHGQLTSHTNPRGAVTSLAFDRYGHVARVTNALGAASVFEHDALGRQQRATDAAGRSTHYTWDAKGRLLRATLPGGAAVACTYDPEDQLTRYTDENGAETRLEYFGIGQISKRAQPDGHSVRYLYDTEEQLTAVVNQRGEKYELKRDALGRIVEEIDYWGQPRRYAYDAGGRITRSIDPLGRVVAFTTDKLGRITQKALPDSENPAKTMHESFRYGRGGQLVEMRNAASHVTRRFDAEGRLIEEQQNGFKIQNTFDVAGNRTHRKTGAGNTVGCAFDLLDQFTRITINDAAPITIERNTSGQAVAEQLSPHLKRTLAYNAQGLLSAQTLLKDAAPLFETRFDYDASGNLTRRSDSEHGIDSYRYDPMGRVLEHTDPACRLQRFANDPAGDRLRTRIREVQMKQAVGGDALPATWVREGEFEGLHCVFDRAGNMTHRRHDREADQPALHLEWDANQRLVKSHWERGQRHGQITTYGYDSLGRRVFKRNPADTTWFFWDGDALLGEVTRGNELSPPTTGMASTTGQVVDLTAARARLEALKALHPQAREYVYRPETFEPLALIDRQATTLEATARVQIDAGAAAKVGLPAAASVNGGGTPSSRESGLGTGLRLSAARLEKPPSVSRERSISLGTLTLDSMARLDHRHQQAVAPDPLAHLEQAKTFQQAPPTDIADIVAPTKNDTLGAPYAVFTFNNDMNGCPTQLLGSDGRVVWSARFAAQGQTIEFRITEVYQPIRLQGQQADEETSLHYNRYRYYEPATGQFASQDPLGQDPSDNVYDYGENTFKWIDPSGLAKCSRLVTDGTDLVLEIKNKFRPGSKESRQLQRFIAAWNEELAKAGGSMTKRGALSSTQNAASATWKKIMRDQFPARFSGKVVGHTPDAIMGGGIAGPRAMALLTSVNSYLGGVAGGVPSGTAYNVVRLFR